MSRQLGSLHRSNSHPANLQNPVPIIPLFVFPPPDCIFNVPSNTDSDTNTDTSVFRTISQYNNSDLETPDEFANSEPSPSTYSQSSSQNFSQPPFKPITASQPLPSLSTPSYPSQVTPTYTSSLTDRSTNKSPDIPQLSSELENYINLQQQIVQPGTLR